MDLLILVALFVGVLYVLWLAEQRLAWPKKQWLYIEPTSEAQAASLRAIMQPRVVTADEEDAHRLVLVRRAMHKAFMMAGQPLESYRDDFLLTPTGKTHDVLHHASRMLGIDHGLETVGAMERHLVARLREEA